MLGIFEKVESPQLKMKALTSCGQTQDPELVKQYLEYAFSGKVRSNNVLYVLATLSSNAAARNIAWEYVKTNWKTKSTRSERVKIAQEMGIAHSTPAIAKT